jgi:hypothetical protein
LFSRPPCKIQETQDDLHIQFLDIDFIYAPKNPILNEEYDSFLLPQFRIFGISQERNSFCVNVHGFLPYFYVAATGNDELDYDVAFFENICKQFYKKNIDAPPPTVNEDPFTKLTTQYVRNKMQKKEKRYVHNVETVIGKNIYGFNDYQKMLKITLYHHNTIYKLSQGKEGSRSLITARHSDFNQHYTNKDMLYLRRI